jgi:uncharacterized protein (TIGR02444 family)
MTDRPLELDNPFWCFSLAVYGSAGVSEACLAVQDELRGDVNLLLFCAWLGAARGVRLDEAMIATLEQRIAAWNEAATHPLRTARRAIKTLPESLDPAVADLRKDAATLELRAEQIAQALLYAQASAFEGASGDVATAEANVALYMAALERAAGKPQGAISAAALIEAAMGVTS